MKRSPSSPSSLLEPPEKRKKSPIPHAPIHNNTDYAKTPVEITSDAKDYDFSTINSQEMVRAITPSQDVESGEQSSQPVEKVKIGPRIFTGITPFDHYQLENVVGEGTFGVVTVAKDKDGQKVALKRILTPLLQKEGFPITALREIKILKTLNHPNCLHLLSMALVGGSRDAKEPSIVSMVFPYYAHDLAGLLENPLVPTFSPAIVKLLLKQMLQGLDYLHEQKIIHRDIKSANMLVGEDGRLVIADFGLARWTHSKLKWKKVPEDNGVGKYTSQVVTRWYRPPELCLSAPTYGFAVDVWGIACIFGEMFERKPIFAGHTDEDQIMKIWQTCGTPTQEAWPGWDTLPGTQGRMEEFGWSKRKVRQRFARLPPDALILLDRMLTLNPESRPTAKQCLAMEFFKRGEEIEIGQVPNWPSSHEMDRRERIHGR